MTQAVHRDDAPHLDARRGYGEDQEGDAVLLFRFLAGTDQAENPVGVASERGPDFLAVDNYSGRRECRRRS